MQKILNPLVSPYNAKQLARIEDRIVKYRAGKLGFYAFVADLTFFTGALQEPVTNLCDQIRGISNELHNQFEALVLDDEGGLREPTVAEQDNISQLVQSMVDLLLASRLS